MAHPLVTYVIINYNSRDLLGSCIESIQDQDYHEKEIIFIDNGSTDGSFEFVRENFPQVTAIKNSNIGYAKAGNQGIKAAGGEYVMLLNPDVIFEKDYTRLCIEKMEEDSRIASIAGKIKKYDFAANRKTDIIDTVGLFCYRNRRIIDDGQGIKDKGQFNSPKEVFGVSGACPIYRKKALEDVKIKEEYLDEDFFMYKEDVDIAWRFLLFGWKNFYLPSAKAYHGRGTGVLKKFTHLEVAKNRSKLPKKTKYFSYKNQRLMQVKNELAGNFWEDMIPIIWKEILIAGYVLFREPFLVKAFGQFLSQLPSALGKRHYIMKHKRVSSKNMKQWLSNKKSKYEDSVD